MRATLASMIVGVAAMALSLDAVAALDICGDESDLLYAESLDRSHQPTPAMPTQEGVNALATSGARAISFDHLMNPNRVCPVDDFSALSRVTQLEAITYLPGECLPALARTAKLPALREIEIACGDGTAVDLRTLAVFPALTAVVTTLGCHYGPVGVAPLAALPRLRTFIDGGVEPLQGLEALTNLTGLAFGSERGTVQSLAKLPGLRSVRLLLGATTDLAQLGDLPALEELMVFSSGPVDVTPLARLTSLRHLQIHALYGIKNLAALAGLRGLCRLEIRTDHEPVDIAPFAAFEGLRRLSVSVRAGQSLAPLGQMRALEALRLSSECARGSIDLAPLARPPRLASVTLSGLLKPAHRARLAGKFFGQSTPASCFPKPRPGR